MILQFDISVIETHVRQRFNVWTVSMYEKTRKNDNNNNNNNNNNINIINNISNNNHNKKRFSYSLELFVLA